MWRSFVQRLRNQQRDEPQTTRSISPPEAVAKPPDEPIQKETDQRLHRARAIFEKYGVNLEDSQWQWEEDNSRKPAERVTRKTRMRIKYTCHYCGIVFGLDKVCTSCQHKRCTKCTRNSSKRYKKKPELDTVATGGKNLEKLGDGAPISTGRADSISEYAPSVGSVSSKDCSSNSEGEQSFLGAGEWSAHDPLQVLDISNQMCLEELGRRIVCRILHNLDQSRVRSCAPARKDSRSVCYNMSSSENRAAGIDGSRPCQKGHGDGIDQSDEQGDGSGSNSKRKREVEDPKTKLLACPYAKFDPRRYSQHNSTELNYRKCSSVCLRDISRVKQHLYRVHARPKYYCGACYETFASRDALDQHTKQRPACDVGPAKYEERMTDVQFNAVKRRIIRGDQSELWYGIYSTLFPRGRTPASPYVSSSDPTVINHFVNLFLHIGPEELMNMMRDRREEPGRRLLLGLSTQTIVDEAFEIALPFYQMEVAGGRQQPSHQVPVPEDVADTEEPPPALPSQHHQPRAPSYQQSTYALNGLHPVENWASASAQWLYSDIQNPAGLGVQPRIPTTDQFNYPLYDTQTPAWREASFNMFEVVPAFDAYAQVVYPPLQFVEHPAALPSGHTGLSGGYSGA